MMRQFWTSCSFLLLLVSTLAMNRLHGAIATDPNNRYATPESQLEAARWQAEQSEIERRVVGLRRHERKASYKDDIVAGLQSERLKREEMIYPAPVVHTLSKPEALERNRRLFLKLDGLFISVLLCWWFYRNSRSVLEFARPRLRKIFSRPRFSKPLVKVIDLVSDTEELLIPAPVLKESSCADRSEPRRRSENLPPPLVVLLNDRGTGSPATRSEIESVTAGQNRSTSLKQLHRPSKSVEDTSHVFAPKTEVTLATPGLVSKPQAQNRDPRSELPSAKLARAFFTATGIHLELLQTKLEALRADPPPARRDQLIGEMFTSVHAIVSEAGFARVNAVFRLGCALKTLFRKMMESPLSYKPGMLASAAEALATLDKLYAAASDPDLGRPVQLLVVAEDPTERRAIGGALQLIFTRPDSAESGLAALQVAEEKSYDLVFLDVSSPGVDSFELCLKLHNSPKNRVTPVVFVSGDPESESRQTAQAVGCMSFIAKPVLPCEIQLLALSHIIRRRLERAGGEDRFEALMSTDPQPSNAALLTV